AFTDNNGPGEEGSLRFQQRDKIRAPYTHRVIAEDGRGRSDPPSLRAHKLKSTSQATPDQTISTDPCQYHSSTLQRRTHTREKKNLQLKPSRPLTVDTITCAC
ncbi:unnamed protein product, partial [Ixodes pacificus]